MLNQTQKSLLNDNSQLLIKSIYHFDDNNIDYYQQSFKKFQCADIIHASSFEENQWLLRFNKNHFTKLIFNLDIFPTLNKALKCYILLQISSGKKGPSCVRAHRLIKEAVFLTNGFIIKNIHFLEEKLESLGYSLRDLMAKQVPSFLLFIKHKYLNEFMDLCKKYENRVRKNRSLPNFKDVLLFDDITRDFFANCSKQERIKYFPILLWWRITTIIPMRPDELLQLKKNCIIKEKNNFWITLPRIKQPRCEARDVEVTDRIAISEEIYNLIQEYITVTTSWSNSNYLFPYEATAKFLERGNVAKILKRDHSRIEYHQFYNLLEQFYSDIIYEKADFNIEKIKPGDTRHFAFCNMMLQGFNALTIARIGGHKQIRQQEHYWSHIEYLTQSWVYNLSEKYKRFHTIDKFTREANFSYHELLTRSKIWNDLISYEELIKIDYGYCMDKQFPQNCVGDCRFCKSYFFKPTDENYNEAIIWLMDCSDRLEQKISERVKFMKYISSTIFYDEELLRTSPLGNEQLKVNSAELFRLIEHKSRVDSHLSKELHLEEDYE